MGKVGRYLPAIMLLGGIATQSVATAYQIFTPGPKHGIHERRKELSSILNGKVTPSEVLGSPDRIDEWKGVQEEYEKIMSRSDVQEDLRYYGEQKNFGNKFSLLGLAIAISGAFALAAARHYKEKRR